MDNRHEKGDDILVEPLIQRLLSSDAGRRDVTRLASEAFRRRRQVIVFEVARQLLAVLESRGFGAGRGQLLVAGDSAQWQKIESLSQLRAAMGGRFKNLKERWVEAGFPLREHRGDREGKAAVDPNGWVELSLWINKKGFEVRLAEESEPWLFEL